MSKKALRIVLPVAGAALGGWALPALGALGGGALSAGVGAGLGATAGSAASGAKFGDALKSGAISGLGAGVLSSLGGSSLMSPGAGAPGGASAASSAGAGSAAGGSALPLDLSMIPEGALASTAQGAGAGGAAGLGLLSDLGISPGQLGLLNNASAAAGLEGLGGSGLNIGSGGYMPSGTGLATDLGINIPGPQPTGIGTAVLDQPMGGALLDGGTLGSSAAQPPLNTGVSSSAAPAAGFDYAGSTVGKILNQLGLPQNSVTEALAKNPNLLLSGGGLAANMLMGSRETEGTDDLRRLAEQANARGERYSGYLESGQLPAGAQAGLTQATEAAKAAIRSKYASMNMSGSSAEMQELNDVDSRAQAQGFQMASNLLRTGVEETGIAANLYRALVGLNAQRDAATGRAISSFASALNG